jgi:hypothetical protein
MLPIIAVIVISSILASVLVIAASMLSSRLSRAEDYYLADEIEVEPQSFEAAAGDATNPSP